MHKVPGEIMKAKLRYRCKACGAEEVVGENIDKWQMFGEPPFLRSAPRVDFGTGRVGYVIPPPIIWHECYGELRAQRKNGQQEPAIGYGLCELVGIIPIQDKDDDGSAQA